MSVRIVCDVCKRNEGVMLLRQTEKNKKIEFFLCNECAKRFGCLDQKNIKDKDFMASAFAKIKDEISKRDFDEHRTCPICKTTYVEFMKTNTVGCPACYIVFENAIKKQLESKTCSPAFEKLQPFTGKLPNQIPGFHSTLIDKAYYQKKLSEAVENENYTRAAIYRDEIKKIDEIIRNGGKL